MKGTECVDLASNIDEASAAMHFNDAPRVVTHNIPQIHVYQVSEDELGRLEEGYGQVGEDLTFASTSLGIFLTSVLTLLASSIPNDKLVYFLCACLVSAAVCLYTGLKWRRSKKEFLHVLAKIRSRIE